MEKNEISLHQVKILEFVRHSRKWVTSAEMAIECKVAPRTARHHALYLVNLGLFDLAETFPAHRYKFSDKAAKRNKAYLLRIERAKEIFGF